MKNITSLLLATTLLACNSESKKNEAKNHDAPPLHTISDLTKHGYKGKIRTITYKDYQEVEMVNNQWIPARSNLYAGDITVEYYNENGFLSSIRSDKYAPGFEARVYSDDSFHYSNGILTHMDHFVTYKYEDEEAPRERKLFAGEIYFWLTPHSYKERRFMCRDSTCDSARFMTLEYLLNKDYRVQKIIDYSMEDTNKVDNTTVLTYDKDYNTTSISAPGGPVNVTESVLQRDNNGNPVKMIYIGLEDKYQYSIAYEYY